jgi:ribosomal protein S18 acetylase RimI-like enzyme
MQSFESTPPITIKTTGTFVQTIQLKDGDHQLGRAIWTAADPSQGVIQILELWVDPKARRAGHATQLYHQLIANAREFHKLRKEPLRRVWISMAHKSQVIGRSFLTGQGFHNISTTGGVLQDEDQLIYVKSLD